MLCSMIKCLLQNHYFSLFVDGSVRLVILEKLHRTEGGKSPTLFEVIPLTKDTKDFFTDKRLKPNSRWNGFTSKCSMSYLVCSRGL